MIKEIKTTIKYNAGLLNNPTYKILTLVITELIKKSNEQTQVINNLTEQLNKKL